LGSDRNRDSAYSTPASASFLTAKNCREDAVARHDRRAGTRDARIATPYVGTKLPVNDARQSHAPARTRARGEAVEAPVWAMRQAGRWDPEFNRLRGGLSFYEFSENVELAARASLLPRRFGVDAHHPVLRHHYPGRRWDCRLLRPLGPVPDRPVRRLTTCAD
jgi:hypothetical protein